MLKNGRFGEKVRIFVYDLAGVGFSLIKKKKKPKGGGRAPRASKPTHWVAPGSVWARAWVDASTHAGAHASCSPLGAWATRLGVRAGHRAPFLRRNHLAVGARLVLQRDVS